MRVDRRSVLTAVAGLAALRCIDARATGSTFDAVVGEPTAPIAARRYDSLAAAIDASPADGRTPFRVLVARGTLKEKITITKPLIHLVGEDRHASVVSFDAASGHRGANGEPFGTRGCATLIVQAPGFAARNLTIANGFDYVGNLAKADGDPTKLADPQGVALMLDQGSDRALIDDVELVGHQDTLFIDRGLSLFRRCCIQGSVDFVFGAGRAVLQSCEIVSRFRAGKPRQGYVAAPSTPRSQPYGLVFHDCRLTKEAAVPSSTVVLGRPWRPARQFDDGRYGDPEAVGSAAFINCWMDDHISADGWDQMGYTAKSGERVFLQPADARLVEHGSSGPGAHGGVGRRKLTADEAARYAREMVLDGWRA